VRLKRTIPWIPLPPKGRNDGRLADTPFWVRVEETRGSHRADFGSCGTGAMDFGTPAKLNESLYKGGLKC